MATSTKKPVEPVKPNQPASNTTLAQQAGVQNYSGSVSQTGQLINAINQPPAAPAKPITGQPGLDLKAVEKRVQEQKNAPPTKLPPVVGAPTAPATPTTPTTPATLVAPKTPEQQAIDAAAGKQTEAWKAPQVAAEEANKKIGVDTANANYEAQTTLLNEMEASVRDLSIKKDSLIGENAALQREGATAAHDSAKRDLELQRKKVAEAYDDMQVEQELANKQRKIREETMLGMVYGGFGSVAANQNLEESIMAGERSLVKIKKDAINADTEVQNMITDLDTNYNLDLRKIDQWKAETMNENYTQLQQYIMQIRENNMMATIEKNKAISSAISQYNGKVAEVAASSVAMKYSLAQTLQSRADTLSQQMLQNKRTAISDNRADLGLLLTNYAGKDFSTLPKETQAKIEQMEKDSNLPSGFVKQALEMSKKAEQEKANKEAQFTDENGNVTVVRYNFDTKSLSTMKLGNIGKPMSNKVTTELRYNPATGQEEVYDKETNRYLGPPGQNAAPSEDFSGWASTVGSGKVTQDFNTPVSYFQDGRKTHSAYDIDGQIGDAVKSPVSGKVVEIGPNAGWGNTVVIEDESGNRWRLAHFDSLEKMKAGDTVDAGQFLGGMGNTGHVIKGDKGDGSHIHIEVKDSSGKLLDPGTVSFGGGKSGQRPQLIQDLVDRYTSGDITEEKARSEIKAAVPDSRQQQNYESLFTKAIRSGDGKTPEQMREEKEISAKISFMDEAVLQSLADKIKDKNLPEDEAISLLQTGLDLSSYQARLFYEKIKPMMEKKESFLSKINPFN